MISYPMGSEVNVVRRDPLNAQPDANKLALAQ